MNSRKAGDVPTTSKADQYLYRRDLSASESESSTMTSGRSFPASSSFNAEEFQYALPGTGAASTSPRSRIPTQRMAVIICGWPNEPAFRIARHCVRRGYKMLQFGLSSNDCRNSSLPIPDVGVVQLVRFHDTQAGQRLGEAIQDALRYDFHPVIIDTTNELENLKLYMDSRIPFVFESKVEEDYFEAMQRMEKHSPEGVALISNRMDKRSVAVDEFWVEWARRFPGLFAGHRLEFRTSQVEKQAPKRMLDAMSDLLNQHFTRDDVQSIKLDRDVKSQFQGNNENSGGGEDDGRVVREISLRNAKNTANFVFRQSLDERFESGEGFADAVAFLVQKSKESPRPRVYGIAEVAQQSRFLAW